MQTMSIKLFVRIAFRDDLDLNYAYWGDGLFEPGIHVAVPNKIDSTQ